MKKLIIFCIAFYVVSPIAMAQTAFPTDSVNWKVFIESRNGPQVSKSLMVIEFAGISDTGKIDNITFRRLLYSGARGGVLGTDSIKQRVYFGNNFQDTNYFMLYDFSMEIGDTLKVPEIGTSTNQLEWYVIDTLNYDLGVETREALLVEQNYYGYIFQDIWIKGIGSIHGLFTPHLEPPYTLEHGYHLVCFTDSSTGLQFAPDIFQDSTYSCASRISLPEEPSLFAEDVDIFPNPFSQKLYMHNRGRHSLEITIATARGRIMKRLVLAPEERKEINSSPWPSGVYLVRMQCSGQTITRKVVRGG